MRVTPLIWISFGLVSLTISIILGRYTIVDLVPVMTVRYLNIVGT